MRRFGLFYIAPTLAVLLGVTWPLISGRETLYLRDVLTSHYPLKAVQAEALRRGELPLVDVYRAGGQPLLGNPNVLPLYPDGALLVAASPLWALNAHFWIHLLIAPAAFYWLARAWRLSRPAAWASGVFYTSSGFLLSLLNLYNLIAAAALAPAFVAACLDAWNGAGRRRIRAAVGGLWALLILAGDPLFALLALAAAAAAGAIRERSLPRRPARFAAALACGSALAAPMVLELLRILPLSLRGYRGYSPESALLQSWDPRSVVEWWLPLFFGPPDFSFWGQRFSDGLPPLFYSLSPGLLCLALIPLAGPRRGPAAVWGWGMVAAGLFLALGKWNPAVRWLYEVPGASAMRYPVKMWLLVAMGSALLCAVGFERLLAGGGRRRLRRHFAALGLLFFSAWTLASFTSLGDRLRVLDPQRLAGTAFTHQRLRWAGLCLLSLVVLAALALALHALRRHPARGGALLVGLHLVAQLFFLRSLFDSDASTPYAEPPKLLAAIPAGARLVHGGFKDLFGPQLLHGGTLPFPDASTKWLTRSHFAQLYPFSGIPWGLRYELNPSPEGLDSFLTFSLAQALPRATDLQRLKVLAASGVEVLLLDRELEAAARRRVDPLTRMAIPGGELFVYSQPAAAPVQLVTRIHRAPHMNAALDLLTAPAFDPRTEAVLPLRDGEAPLTAAAGGSAAIVAESADEIVIAIDAESAGVLVVQRTYLEIYRAAIDGEPAAIEPANVHRLAVAVPAGRHTVRVWADRRPTRLAWAAAALGLLGLTLVAGDRRGGARS